MALRSLIRLLKLLRVFDRMPRQIQKYDVAPRLGMRAVERRLRERLPELAASFKTQC